jgi:hypothetical protein
MLKINKEVIDPALVDEAFQRIKSEHEMKSHASCCERDCEFFAKAEEEVIHGILLAQEAEKRYPQLPPTALREAYEQTLKDWRKQGASWDLIESQSSTLHEETAAALRMKLFTEDVCQHLYEPDDLTCKTYYDENPHEFLQAPRARVWHLIRIPDLSNPWIEYRQMLEWREMVLAGADFPSIAAQHTAKQNQSIDLGWIGMERATNSFESILFSLSEGEISPIISYENAFHLVMPAEMQIAIQTPFSKKIEEIRRLLRDRQRREALRFLALELQQHATIERIPDAL